MAPVIAITDCWFRRQLCEKATPQVSIMDELGVDDDIPGYL